MKNELAKVLGKNIKNFRKKKGLTQEKLADKLFYSVKTVAKWERGETIPSLTVVSEIANEFNISIDSLLKYGDETYYLGIDGGGTKTQLVLCNEKGEIINTYFTESCNPNAIGMEKAQKVLSEAIYITCKNVCFSSIKLFAGIAGGGASSNNKEKFSTFFKSFGFMKYENSSDIENVIAAGLGEKDGIVMIMGTGVCLYSQRNGNRKKYSGWGYLLDEGGSAYCFGRMALSAYFSAGDGSGEKTLLTELINEKLGYNDMYKLVAEVYSWDKNYIGQFSSLVFDAMERGDKVATMIVKKNMETVANLIRTAGADFEKGKKIPVILAGGVTNETCLIDEIKKCLPIDNPFEIRLLEGEPVMGAIKIAQTL